MFKNFFAKHSNRLVLFWCGISGWRIANSVRRPCPAFKLPFLSPTIHNFALWMTVEFEDPECITSPPIIFIAIENNCCVIGDAIVSADLLKTLPVDIVPNNLVLR
jgi:hypothetical protein